MDVKIESSWKEALSRNSKPYFASLVETLRTEKRRGRVIYPPGPLIFNAFALTIDKVKVVILGQDPYHGRDRLGLSFSVPQVNTLPAQYIKR